jgi:LuxR family maltose regulon positive regulatory protein
MVPRPRLSRQLDAGREAALTLVVAPLGYGKSTAVRAWCATHPEVPLVWVTLDAGDNDPVRLWRYVATAVDRVREGLGRSALRRLAVSGTAIEDPVVELMNGIAAFGQELVLVLDDLHTVTDAECLASIDHAIAHLPANARLVAISRADPALRLGHLRAQGALAELRADELAFTVAETHELLVERGGIDLGPDETTLLHQRVEGWPAAVVLASLWLRTVDEPVRAVREFGGQHRFVADYLSHEVVDALDEETRAFLLGVAVLGRFTPELCDAVLGRSDSAALLAELERSNMFIARLDRGGWFRIHAVLAEFAGFRLAALEPGADAEIHRRAASWLREQGLAVEALEHATAVDDHDLVADVLIEHYLALIRSGSSRTLLRWIETLPDEQMVEHPQLAASAATAALTVGRRALERRRYLQLVDRALAQVPERVDPFVQSTVAMVRAGSIDGEIGQAVLDGRRAVELARESADGVLVAALGAYARALYFAGDLESAWTAGMQAVEHPDVERRAPGHAWARSTLALVAAERGLLASARTHAGKAKSIVGRLGLGRTWLGANAAAALGAVLIAEDRLAEAERELAYAEHFFSDEVANVQHAWLLVLLARIRCSRGRLLEADSTLKAAQDALREVVDGGRVSSLAAEVERELRQARLRAGGGELLEAPSEAELAVLRLLTTDRSARDIAASLYLSTNTVRSHTRAIYRKLGVNSRAEAVARATALGLLDEARSPG